MTDSPEMKNSSRLKQSPHRCTETRFHIKQTEMSYFNCHLCCFLLREVQLVLILTPIALRPLLLQRYNFFFFLVIRELAPPTAYHAEPNPNNRAMAVDGNKYLMGVPLRIFLKLSWNLQHIWIETWFIYKHISYLNRCIWLRLLHLESREQICFFHFLQKIVSQQQQKTDGCENLSLSSVSDIFSCATLVSSLCVCKWSLCVALMCSAPKFPMELFHCSANKDLYNLREEL